jgi:hypothetical protein
MAHIQRDFNFARGAAFVSAQSQLRVRRAAGGRRLETSPRSGKGASAMYRIGALEPAPAAKLGAISAWSGLVQRTLVMGRD